MRIPTFVINLDRDRERYEAISAQLWAVSHIEPIRVSAFAGRTLSHTAAHILTGNSWSHEHKGTLGCFLSHVGVWETVSRYSDVPFALVTEDNANFIRIDMLKDLNLPHDCDVAFCNWRTAYPVDGQSDDVPYIRGIDGVLPYVAMHGQAIGTDGYLITPNGARKLVQFVAKDGLFTHVDMRMFAYAIDVTESSNDGTVEPERTVNALRKVYHSSHRINAYSVYPAITERRLGIESTRVKEDQGGSQSLITCLRGHDTHWHISKTKIGK